MLWRNPKKQTALLLYCRTDSFMKMFWGLVHSLLRQLGEEVKNESCERGGGSIQGQGTLVCS